MSATKWQPQQRGLGGGFWGGLGWSRVVWGALGWCRGWLTGKTLGDGGSRAYLVTLMSGRGNSNER